MSGDRKIPASARSARLREFLAVGLGIAVTAAAYFGTLGRFSTKPVTREAVSHYAYLTDALLSGQLYFKVPPDPRLLQLRNPYAGWQGIPLLHDASLYRGHYYLYFGVTPVVVLLGPWRLLTGTFLSDGVTVVIFSFAGFLLGTTLWAALRRRFFPDLAPLWLGFGVLLLGLGNYVFFLLQAPQFYQVAISCAYACLMAALLLIFGALEAERPKGRALALGGASLAWSLAVGARPDYLFSLAALAVPALILWRRAGREEGFSSGRAWRIALAAAFPVAVVGAGLAWYNWARFGSLVEFGVHYQLAGADESHVTVASLANVPAGLAAYLFAPPHYALYFPFLSADQTFGLLPWAPFAAAIIGFPLTLLDARRRRDRTWPIIGAAIALAALLNFSALCLYWFRQDRYAIDFLPAALLGALLVAAAAATGRPWVRRTAGSVLAAAAALTLAQSTLLALGVPYQAGGLRSLARAVDRAVTAVEGRFGVGYGPVSLTLVLPAHPPGLGDEPLVSTAAGWDRVYLRENADGRVQLGFFHRGVGGPISDPIKLDRTQPHVVDVDLGSLYPPADHPLFAGWADDHISALGRRVRVRLDGHPILDCSSEFYPNDPLETAFGRSPAAGGGEPAFSGRISRVRRAGLPRSADLDRPAINGPVRLTLRFPRFQGVYGEPLVSTGPQGRGDLVYVVYLAPNRVRFEHDSWNAGPVQTPSVAYDPAQDQVVEIDLGSLEWNQANPRPGNARFRLRFNGRELISTFRPFHPTNPIDVVFGFNAAHSSAAAASFTGPKFQAERLPPPSSP